jgi:hypothetical protein
MNRVLILCLKQVNIAFVPLIHPLSTTLLYKLIQKIRMFRKKHAGYTFFLIEIYIYVECHYMRVVETVSLSSSNL